VPFHISKFIFSIVFDKLQIPPCNNLPPQTLLEYAKYEHKWIK